MGFRIPIRTCAVLRTLACAAVAAIVLQLTVLPHQPVAYEVVAASSDKLVHGAVFAVLAFLLWIAAGGRGSLAILAAVAAIGASDEIVQVFTPARQPDLLDLAADLAGAAVTLFLLHRFARAAVPAPRVPLTSTGA